MPYSFIFKLKKGHMVRQSLPNNITDRIIMEPLITINCLLITAFNVLETVPSLIFKKQLYLISLKALHSWEIKWYMFGSGRCRKKTTFQKKQGLRHWSSFILWIKLALRISVCGLFVIRATLSTHLSKYWLARKAKCEGLLALVIPSAHVPESNGVFINGLAKKVNEECRDTYYEGDHLSATWVHRTQF